MRLTSTPGGGRHLAQFVHLVGGTVLEQTSASVLVEIPETYTRRFRDRHGSFEETFPTVSRDRGGVPALVELAADLCNGQLFLCHPGAFSPWTLYPSGNPVPLSAYRAD